MNYFLKHFALPFKRDKAFCLCYTIKHKICKHLLVCYNNYNKTRKEEKGTEILIAVCAVVGAAVVGVAIWMAVSIKTEWWTFSYIRICLSATGYI